MQASDVNRRVLERRRRTKFLALFNTEIVGKWNHLGPTLINSKYENVPAQFQVFVTMPRPDFRF